MQIGMQTERTHAQTIVLCPNVCSLQLRVFQWLLLGEPVLSMATAAVNAAFYAPMTAGNGTQQQQRAISNCHWRSLLSLMLLLLPESSAIGACKRHRWFDPASLGTLSAVSSRRQLSVVVLSLAQFAVARVIIISGGGGTRINVLIVGEARWTIVKLSDAGRARDWARGASRNALIRESRYLFQYNAKF